MRRSAFRFCGLIFALLCVFVSSAHAQSIWVNPSDGDWSDAARWSMGVPNGLAIDATIDATGAAYTVNADIDVSLNLLTIDSADAILFLNGRSWTINDRIKVDAGTMDLRGATSITGLVENNGGTIAITGATAGGHANVAIGTLTNNSTLTLGSLNSNWNASLTGDVSNNGIMNILAGTGGARTYSGIMANNGAVTVDRRFDINGASTWNQSSGSIVGNELFVINTGTMNITGGAMSGQVVVNDGTINVSGPSTATGAVQAQGITQLIGVINDGFEVTVQGSTNGGHATGVTQAGFMNQGTLALESISTNWNSSFDATAGFTNSSTGKLEVRAGTGGGRDIFGDIVNQGTIDGTGAEYRQSSGSLQLDGGQLLGEIKTLGTSINSTGATTGDIKLHGAANTLGGTINSGLTVRVRGSNDGGNANATTSGTVNNQGNLILDSANSNWNTTLTGTVTNQAGATFQTLEATGGAKTVDGLLTNQGILDFQTNTTITGTGLNLEGGSLSSTGRTTVDGATLNASGGAVSGLVVVRNGTLDFSSASSLTGQIETYDETNLNGTINSGASVVVRGANFGGNGVTTTSAGTVNDGTLELSTVDSTWSSTLNATSGFTNNGTFKSSIGTGGARNIVGQVDNFGQVEIGVQTDLTGAGFAMKGGTISGDGLLRLTGGAVFTAEQGAVTGRVAIDDGQIVFGPGSTTTGIIEARGVTTLDGTIGSGATVSIKGANLGGASALTTNAGAINNGRIELDSIDSNWSSSFDISSGLSNNGTIAVLAGAGGPKSVTGDLTNNGVLDGTLNDFRFDGTLDMNSGSADGNFIIHNTGATFGSAASGKIIARGNGNTAAGLIGVDMTLQINGSNDGGTGLVTTVGTLNNAGRIILESENTNWQTNLTGSILNQSTGLIEVNEGTSGARILNLTLDSDGDFVVRTNASLGVAGSAHENRGTMTIESGRLDLIGLSFENTGRLEGNGILDLNNSVAFNNAGIVGPGLSPGTLTIDGDYVQDSIGMFEVELAGLLAGEFDVLAVNGNAALDGTLAVNSNFAYMTGNSFRILTTTELVSGTFSIEPNSNDWNVVYGSNFVDLIALRSVPEPSSLFVCMLTGLAFVSRRRRVQKPDRN